MSTLKTMQRYGITLSLFAAATTGLVALINQFTAPTIAEQAKLQQKKIIDQVIPPDYYDNDLFEACYVVTDPLLGNATPHRLYVAKKANIPVAVAIESTAIDGYSGAIQLLVGAGIDGAILGVRVTEHHETPGLGDKIEIKRSPWITLFTGKIVTDKPDSHWAVKKEGGDFDQFTGATITPKAVVNQTKQAVLYLLRHRQQIEQLPHCGEDL